MKKITLDSAWLVVASALWLCFLSNARGQSGEPKDSVEITTNQHDDEGPNNRYSVPYEPITYGQDIKAPLPGLAYDYKLVDWDGDGVLDIISGSMGRRLYFFKGKMTNNALRFEKPRNFRFNDSTLALPDRLLPGVVDWNGDGEPDWILSDDPGHVIVYEGIKASTYQRKPSENHDLPLRASPQRGSRATSYRTNSLSGWLLL